MSYKTDRTDNSNIDQTISFLKFAFDRATRSFGYKNHKGTELYVHQCEFMWIMHEITNGPIYSMPHFIQEANNIIRSIEEEKKAKDKPKEK